MSKKGKRIRALKRAQAAARAKLWSPAKRARVAARGAASRARREASAAAISIRNKSFAAQRAISASISSRKKAAKVAIMPKTASTSIKGVSLKKPPSILIVVAGLTIAALVAIRLRKKKR